MNTKNLVLPTSAEDLTLLRLTGETDKTLYSLINHHFINTIQDRRDLIYLREETLRMFLVWLIANPWAYKSVSIDGNHAYIVLSHSGIYRSTEMNVFLSNKVRSQIEKIIELNNSKKIQK